MVRPGSLLLWALLCLGISSHISEGAEAPDEQVKDLTNKNLQTIPPRDANCTVTSLLLSGNQIRLNESDRLALVSYSGLTQLYLDRNMVRNISAKYFSQVPSLEVLSLSGNKLSRLDPDVFVGLDGLTQLDLSNNSLTVFPYQLLKSLKSLQLLNIEGNPWDCPCEHLLNLSEAPEERRFSLAANVICASPQSMLGLKLSEAIVKCFPASTTASTKAAPPETSSLVKQAPTAQGNDTRSKDESATQSNSWKFTVSVAALGLTTAVVIVFAIKGPSWYKLFHNYRHRRLQDEHTGTTVFHQTPRQQQTYTFEEEGGRQRRTEEEEDEDGYFEDPYIRRDENIGV